MSEAPTFVCDLCGAVGRGTWLGDPDACTKPGCLVAHGIPEYPEGWDSVDLGPTTEGWAQACADCSAPTPVGSAREAHKAWRDEGGGKNLDGRPILDLWNAKRGFLAGFAAGGTGMNMLTNALALYKSYEEADSELTFAEWLAALQRKAATPAHEG